MRVNFQNELLKYSSALACEDTTIPSLRNVGIGITTKDRWDDLEATLTGAQLQGLFGLGNDSH